MTKLLLHTAAGLIAACALGISPASADEIQLNYTGITGGGVGVDVTVGSQHQTMQVGRTDWVAFDGGAGFGESLSTFAIQAVGTSGSGTYEQSDLASDGHGMSSAEVLVAAELFERHFADANEFSAPESTGDLVQAAAFQLVVWEISSESHDDDVFSVAASLDLTDGTVSARAAGFGEHTDLFDAALSTAQSWIAELASTSEFNSEYLSEMFGYRMGDRFAPGNLVGATLNPVMVPLPTPVWIAAAGLLGVMVTRRRLA